MPGDNDALEDAHPTLSGWRIMKVPLFTCNWTILGHSELTKASLNSLVTNSRSISFFKW